MTSDRKTGYGTASAAVLLAGVFLVAPALGQRKESAPKDLLEVGITEHLSDQIPLDLPFVDSKGKAVTLGNYFDGSKPVLLTLNYSNCPMLCSLQLTGLFDGLKKMDWSLGNEYRMVTVSIDPAETPERAALAKRRYLKQYGRADSGAGYECLTGKNEHIKRLADTVGFHYRYVPETGEFAHAAATFVCTPAGRLSRYLYGVEYDPQTVRFALLEASEGKIGTTVDQLLLFCFHYDSASGKYGPSAFKLMRLGGIATVFAVGSVLLVYWRRERKDETPTNPAELPS